MEDDEMNKLIELQGELTDKIDHVNGWDIDSKSYKKNDNNRVRERAEKQLAEYFQGKRREFDLQLSPEGTDFQKSVWKGLSKIDYGKTISYGEQARRIGNPKAMRAVGGANGKNPIAIIIPCHRVIGSNGTLTGFGGGLNAKTFLLNLEKSHSLE